MPAANAYVVQEGRTYGMGTSMTTFMLAMNVGNGIGPVALGSIADWLGLDAAFHAAAVCMVIGLVIFALMVRGNDRKAEPGGAKSESDRVAAKSRQ